MKNGILGEIKIFSFDYAPKGWAQCDGQLLPIAKHSALFTLIGTRYGGDGRATFALPDLRNRVIVHASEKAIAQKGGVEKHQLIKQEMPSHTHTGKIKMADNSGETFNGANKYLAKKALDLHTTPSMASLEIYVREENATFAQGNELKGLVVNHEGGNQPFSIMQPYLVLNQCICIDGDYPARS